MSGRFDSLFVHANMPGRDHRDGERSCLHDSCVPQPAVDALARFRRGRAQLSFFSSFLSPASRRAFNSRSAANGEFGSIGRSRRSGRGLLNGRSLPRCCDRGALRRPCARRHHVCAGGEICAALLPRFPARPVAPAASAEDAGRATACGRRRSRSCARFGWRSPGGRPGRQTSIIAGSAVFSRRCGRRVFRWRAFGGSFEGRRCCFR